MSAENLSLTANQFGFGCAALGGAIAFMSFAVGLPGVPFSAAVSSASRSNPSSFRGSMEKSVVRGWGARAMDSVMVMLGEMPLGESEGGRWT